MNRIDLYNYTGNDTQLFGIHRMIISEGCAIESSDIGIAAELRWNTDPLPVFAQWKSMVSGDYVLGLEPSNCYIKGRNAERDIKNIGWIFKHTG